MTQWENFFVEKITKIFSESKHVVDIGGGLRISKKQGNRYDPRRAWITPLAKRVDYKILDPVPDYDPDIVGDIHALPFKDDSQEAVVCISVLEHVENPIQAAKEIYRVLKPGGYAFLYVPFLFYYHAEAGYYKDYWRFTHDTVELLFGTFIKREYMPVRGALGTWLHISPLGKSKLLTAGFGFLDRIFGKDKSLQVSGYYIFLEK